MSIDLEIQSNDTELNLVHEKAIVIEAEAGGYYTPSAEQLDENTVRLSFTPSKGSMLPITPTDLTILKGDKGDKGDTGEKGDTPSLESTLDAIYPVGSIYISDNTTPPDAKLGGTWGLIDKEFKSDGGSSTTLFTTTTMAVSSGTSYFARSGHTLRFKVPISYAGMLSGTNLVMGTINFEALGVSAIGFSITDAVVFSDKSGNGVSYTISNTSDSLGQVTFNNIIGTSGTSHTYYIDHTIVFNQKNMIDSFCNKFYWKRIA